VDFFDLLTIISYVQASVVSVLYIWCVATDPVDAHVQSLKHQDLSLPSFKKKNSVSSHTINTEKHALSSCICMEKSNEEISIPEDDILYCNLCKVEVKMPNLQELYNLFFM
jgi:hypothetical protein